MIVDQLAGPWQIGPRADAERSRRGHQTGKRVNEFVRGIDQRQALDCPDVVVGEQVVGADQPKFCHIDRGNRIQGI